MNDADPQHGPDRTIVLEARGVSKRFGAVLALDEVSCTVRSGEVLAVVGENGAGKSTLMKILSGVHEPDGGELRFEGRPTRMRSVRHAQDLGVSLVHQELNLAENLDVAANIVLGREPRRLGMLDGRAASRIADDALRKVGLSISPRTPVASLGVGSRQLVEIAKSIAADARVLILDEPTASLSKAEADRLVELVSQLRQGGTAVVLISHRLDEVLRMADRIVVLRDGRQRGELDRSEATREKIVSLMVGRDVEAVERRPIESGPVRLALKDLRSDAHPRHAVDLEIRGGEVVGLAGLVGSGRTELLETIFGVRRARAGVVEIEGVRLPPGDPRTAVARGVALVPEDRGRHGLFLPDPIRLNFAMASLADHSRGGVLSFQAIRRLADRLAEDLHLRPPDHARAAGTLSGGNQQKVVLGRWIARSPKVLLLDEPTRGVDVGARAEIHAIVRDLAAKGCAVLFASSELDEVLSLADRIVCLREGEITGDLDAADAGEEAVMARLVAEQVA